jgi:hypothetical protein
VPAAAPKPAAPDAPAAPAPAPALSRRQQKANERTQAAVESATTALREENARIKAQLDSQKPPHIESPAAVAPPAPVVAQPAPVVPAPAAEPEWKRLAAMPDAPKLADFETIEQYNFAVNLFVADKRAAEAAQRGQSEDAHAVMKGRIDRFEANLAEAMKAPDFKTSITPLVAQQLKPFDARKRDDKGNFIEKGTALNAVGEHVYDSPILGTMLRHFSTPAGEAELRRLTNLPDHLKGLPDNPMRARLHIAWIAREYGKIEGRLEAAAAPAPAPNVPAPKLITDAPAPARTLGHRPAEAADPRAAAIRSGDTRAYREIRRAERAAGGR